MNVPIMLGSSSIVHLGRITAWNEYGNLKSDPGGLAFCGMGGAFSGPAKQVEWDVTCKGCLRIAAQEKGK